MKTAIERLARAMAILGGVVLTLLVLLTCVSVLGRGLNSMGHSDWLIALSQTVADGLIASGVGPVTGDFELVEAGIAFAIFAFLPICQLYSGHATVDIFTSRLSDRVNTWLVAFWDVVLSLLIWLITWRLFAGLLDKLGNGETTFLLQFPMWWAYAASFVAALVASVTALYCSVGRVAYAVTGRSVLPPSGADAT
ncbi:TRAP transporter small permease [Marivita geojedonensis]|uniref:TRAP transporter small permease protein n=1 Tax=Marivita geojedonensis TaxID=1123756 RepID=A0A1X4NHA1_9RHOB|nr:TRAP transporter small permease [Marivita geojedonensis]OSQ46596.1 C4-dicarboxylate ABC transporter permease [Marivita geojedonensis]PRY74193.1 tripartite ATP-independent transporter DctQ subunit [Marivita geojedonensis]